GLAFKISPTTLLGVDYQKIKYTDVKSVSNSSSLTGALGTAGGRGFGWGDIDVFKIGVQYQHSDRLTIRAGIDRSDNPIRPADVTFNILAPGVVTNHYSVGFTLATDKSSELTGAYTYVAEKKVSGTSLFQSLGVAGAGTEEIKMHQNVIGLAWSTKW
ncbi:MAG: outer membrane protein transport protein, partial [Pseudomonadota bacterium]